MFFLLILQILLSPLLQVLRSWISNKKHVSLNLFELLILIIKNVFYIFFFFHINFSRPPFHCFRYWIFKSLYLDTRNREDWHQILYKFYHRNNFFDFFNTIFFSAPFTFVCYKFWKNTASFINCAKKKLIPIFK